MNQDKSKEINWEEVSMSIITYAGTAKTKAMLAITEAKKNDFASAQKLLTEANKNIDIASHQHMDVITQEARGTQHLFKVLFIHAEDQLLTTQTLILMAKELIELYRRIQDIDNIK